MSHYDTEILRLKLDFCCTYLGEALAYRTDYSDVPQLAIDKQHQDIKEVYTTLRSMYDYINDVSEEEQRQGTSSQVSGVFAVSS